MKQGQTTMKLGQTTMIRDQTTMIQILNLREMNQNHKNGVNHLKKKRRKTQIGVMTMNRCMNQIQTNAIYMQILMVKLMCKLKSVAIALQILET